MADTYIRFEQYRTLHFRMRNWDNTASKTRSTCWTNRRTCMNGMDHLSGKPWSEQRGRQNTTPPARRQRRRCSHSDPPKSNYCKSSASNYRHKSTQSKTKPQELSDSRWSSPHIDSSQGRTSKCLSPSHKMQNSMLVEDTPTQVVTDSKQNDYMCHRSTHRKCRCRCRCTELVSTRKCLCRYCKSTNCTGRPQGTKLEQIDIHHRPRCTMSFRTNCSSGTKFLTVHTYWVPRMCSSCIRRFQGRHRATLPR